MGYQDESSICLSCKKDLYLQDYQSCVAICKSGQNQCQINCPNGMVTGNNQKCLVECQDKNCETCSNTLTTCQKCFDDYFLNTTTQKCIKEIENCFKYNDDYSCHQCQEGFILNNATRQCEEFFNGDSHCTISITNCKICEETNSQGKICSQCILGYILMNNECYSQQNYQNCQKINQISKDCEECSQDSTLNNSTGKCEQFLPQCTIPQCVKCDSSQPRITCIQCEEGLLLNDNECQIYQTCGFNEYFNTTTGQCEYTEVNMLYVILEGTLLLLCTFCCCKYFFCNKRCKKKGNGQEQPQQRPQPQLPYRPQLHQGIQLQRKIQHRNIQPVPQQQKHQHIPLQIQPPSFQYQQVQRQPPVSEYMAQFAIIDRLQKEGIHLTAEEIAMQFQIEHQINQQKNRQKTIEKLKESQKEFFMKDNDMMMSSRELKLTKKTSNDIKVCAICLDPLDDRECKKYPCGKHEGHTDCIDSWKTSTQDDAVDCIFRCPKK